MTKVHDLSSPARGLRQMRRSSGRVCRWSEDEEDPNPEFLRTRLKANKNIVFELFHIGKWTDFIERKAYKSHSGLIRIYVRT